MFCNNGSDSTTVQGNRMKVGRPPIRSLDPSESTMQTSSMAKPTRTTRLRRRMKTTATTSSSGMPR